MHSFTQYYARVDGSMPDNGLTLQEEVVMIRVFPAIIDELIPETWCIMSAKDKLFSPLGIVPFVKNKCMKLNLIIIMLEE